MFLSGLDLASSFENLPLKLLTEWICGMSGDAEAQEDITRIIRVIIAGIPTLFYIFSFYNGKRNLLLWCRVSTSVSYTR